MLANLIHDGSGQLLQLLGVVLSEVFEKTYKSP
jgi:hypothetical protein